MWKRNQIEAMRRYLRDEIGEMTDLTRDRSVLNCFIQTFRDGEVSLDDFKRVTGLGSLAELKRMNAQIEGEDDADEFCDDFADTDIAAEAARDAALIDKRVDAALEKALSSRKSSGVSSFSEESDTMPEVTPQMVFGGRNTATAEHIGSSYDAGAGQSVRIKGCDERLSTHRRSMVYPTQTKSGDPHPLSGQRVVYRGHEMDHASQLDDARLGAWVHMTALHQGYRGPFGDFDIPPLSEFKKQLIREMASELEFVGDAPDGRLYTGQKLSDFDRKALLDDSSSGGTNLVPTEWDRDLVAPLVLYNEVLRHVSMRDTRSNSVTINSIGTPTLAWGTFPGTAITPLTTTSFITSVSADVERVSGAMEISLDLLDDVPQALGEEIRMQYQQAYGAEMDRVILHGNGSDEPLGIFNTSSTVAVSSTNGTSGPLHQNDVSNLYFGIPRQYRKPELNVRFLMNDDNYKAFRQIATGVTGDTRYVFGLELASYTFFPGGPPVSVEVNVSDNDALCVPLALYRLYRRAGFAFRWEVGGNYLPLRGLGLLVCTGRFAGRYSIPAAAAEVNDLLNPNAV